MTGYNHTNIGINTHKDKINWVMQQNCSVAEKRRLLYRTAHGSDQEGKA